MRRDGTNPQSVEMSDVLCDYCHTQWTIDRPMIEGHQGACICGNCLRQAFCSVKLAGCDDAIAGQPSKCTMCLEDRSDACFRSPAFEAAVICQRCITMAAKALSRDPDSNWTPPTDETPAQRV